MPAPPIFRARIAKTFHEPTGGDATDPASDEQLVIEHLHGRIKHAWFNTPVFVEPWPAEAGRAAAYAVYVDYTDTVFLLSAAAAKWFLKAERDEAGQLVGDPKGLGAELAARWKSQVARRSA